MASSELPYCFAEETISRDHERRDVLNAALDLARYCRGPAALNAPAARAGWW